MTEKKLITKVRDSIRTMHYSIRTEKAYIQWIIRFVKFHNLRHPEKMGASEVQEYLNYLAVKCDLAASSQNQAFTP